MTFLLPSIGQFFKEFLTLQTLKYFLIADNVIVSGSTDRTLKVWNADTGSCQHTLHGHTSTVRCMHLHGQR